MSRIRAMSAMALCIAVGCLTIGASGAGALARGHGAFRPRIGKALGIIPAAGIEVPASGPLTVLDYHGGPTMSGGVTIHTIFWSGGTHPFEGQPSGAPHDYEGMLQQFFGDVAHDSTGTAGGTCTISECNVFTVEPQYGSGTTPGHVAPGDYNITYKAGSDSIEDADPYPPKSQQCASPFDAGVCITDVQVQAEIEHVVQETGGERGLHNLWYVFLPPDVDECAEAPECASNVFGAYHSWVNRGHGLTIYAVGPDEMTYVKSRPGGDPEGFPNAEYTISAAAHEVNEAMSDPVGTGWYDTSGAGENGDKCEFGPQYGTPLGFAPDGSPYNQVINAHKYLIQEMWANADENGKPDCVRATGNTASPLPLPQVQLTQFSSTVSGNTENNTAGVGVQVSLIRPDQSGEAVTVADASTTTAADGSWSLSLAPHAVGDERDEIGIDYSGAGAPEPERQVIQSGNGTSSGWFITDNDTSITNQAALGGPSFSTPCVFGFGVASSSITAEPLFEFCNEGLVASEPLAGPVENGTAVTFGMTDNDAFQPPEAPVPNANGSLVTQTVPVGEADSISSAAAVEQFLAEFGRRSCRAGSPPARLSSRRKRLPVAGSCRVSYTITDGSQSAIVEADEAGTVERPLSLKGGDALTLSNGLRTLTTLHVAHLRVEIDGSEPATVAGGTCEPVEYFGEPVTQVALSSPPFIKGPSTLTGQICPQSGDATGLPTSDIAQTDEFSGGLTQLEVPEVTATWPMAGESLYGAFTALAEASDSSSPVAVSIAPSSGGPPVFTTANTDTANGVAVPALTPGSYRATWTVTDANGDTRTTDSRFSEQSGLQGAPGQQGAPGIQGPQGAPGPRGHQPPPGPKAQVNCKIIGKRHRTIQCSVRFAKTSSGANGLLLVSITRGSRLAALGHGTLRHGAANITMRELRRLSKGTWRITLVVSGRGHATRTLTMELRVGRLGNTAR